MAYSIYTDVASEFRGIDFSSTSVVTSTEVTEFIAQADQYIDSRIGLKYSVPVSSSDSPLSFKILKRLSIWLVTSRIKDILKVKTGVDTGEQQTRENDPGKMARDEIDMIVKGTLLLPDATLASSADGFRSYSVDAGQEFTFSRDSDDW